MKMIARLLTFLLLATLGMAEDASLQRIHEGKHWDWYARADQFRQYRTDIEAIYDYADKAYETLCKAWELKPSSDRYVLLVMERPGGGFAADDVREVRALTVKRSPGIGCAYDAFLNTVDGIKGYWAPVLITHEMVNLFTSQLVPGGWPVDWWANHRSPFPLMTAIEVESALLPAVAAVHNKEGRADPLVRMFQHLKDQYGWAMFRKAFRTARADGINWDAFGANPSALRTAYVAAYLQLGAPEDLSGILQPLVPKYDAPAVQAILAARARWITLAEHSTRRETLKAAYLKGDYEAAAK